VGEERIQEGVSYPLAVILRLYKVEGFGPLAFKTSEAGNHIEYIQIGARAG